MVSRSAVGLAGRSLLVHMRFQSLPLLRVAGTVTAERNLQRLQRWHANHTGRVNANESKTRFVQVEGSNCIKCHTQAALAFVPEFARLTLPGLRAALLFQGTLPAITAAGGVKPWRAPSRSDWRPRPPKAATMSHPQASARRRCSGDPADALLCRDAARCTAVGPPVKRPWTAEHGAASAKLSIASL
jgi:hypothetical protein